MFGKSPLKIIAFLTAGLIFLFSFSGVFAVAPLDLHIEALELIGTSGETFNASGPAVNAGLICSTGTVDDLSVVVSGSPGSPLLILDVHKRFYCGDGTFDVFMIVQLDTLTSETTARWRLDDGSGNYAGVKGTGSLIGTPVNPGISVFDVYDGKVH